MIFFCSPFAETKKFLPNIRSTDQQTAAVASKAVHRHVPHLLTMSPNSYPRKAVAMQQVLLV